MLGKRIINTATGAAPSACTTDTVQILGDTSCIAYYKMSDATDETGSYDGTIPSNALITSPVNFNTEGKFGFAGAFNGTSNGINLPSSLNTNVINPTGAFSISMWINANNISTIQYLFAANISDNIDLGINTGQGAGKIVWTIYNGSYSYLTSTTTITTNTWYHIVATYNNSLRELFIDGVSQGTATKTLVQSNIEPTLGYRFTGGNVLFNGKIDQVRIFNRAITPNEVETLYDEVQCIPTIVPSEHFNPVLYTGNGSTQAITSLDFQPDLVWIKNRTTTGYEHFWWDSVRGAGGNKDINSDSANYEGEESTSVYGYLSSFDSNGFTLNSGTTNAVTINRSSDNYVAWCWKAGGPDVLNTDGTIDSQVSANVDAGFSIVSYTGNGANGTVGHGLGVTPNIIIVKRRNLDTAWSISGNTGGLIYGSNKLALEKDLGLQPDTNEVLAANSNTFTAGTSSAVGASGGTYVAYCFAEVDGFSKFGSYTGTGSTNGNFVVTGFRPAFVMIKAIDRTAFWVIKDNKRNTSNPRSSSLYPNSSTNEFEDNQVNFFTNGFQPISTDSDTNNGTASYIYMAFAEEVFVPDNFFNDDSTVATYKLDGDAGDDSGNGYDGTAPNVTYAAGKFDEAAVFNGSNSVIYSSNTTEVFNNTTKQGTISFWVKFDTLGSTQNIANRWDLGGATVEESWGLWYVTGSNHLQFTHRDSSNNITLATSNAGLFTINTWYNVSVIWNGSNVSFYVNGSFVNTVTNAGFNDALKTTTARLTLGATLRNGNDSTQENLDGSLDQVRIFDRALDAEEVTQLYNE